MTVSPRAAIFAPSPTLTVTIEDHPSGAEIHVHAGGQGVWQARMLRQLGVESTLCSVLSGEVGRIVRGLLAEEGIGLAAVERDGRGSAYVHDRRGGERIAIADVDGDPLGRHELDELYGLMLGEALAAGVAVLSGPVGEEALPPDTYRRLAADLREAGVPVVVDLAGERMRAALAGGVEVLKVSHEELAQDGLTSGGLADSDSAADIRAAMHRLRELGAGTVIVTRAEEPLWLLDEEGMLEVTPPRLEVADHRGAGDSLTAGVVAGMTRGERPREAIVRAAAAGALNVTRHGLGTGGWETIDRLSRSVVVRALPDEGGDPEPGSARVTPDGLADLARAPEDEPEPGSESEPE